MLSMHGNIHLDKESNRYNFEKVLIFLKSLLRMVMNMRRLNLVEFIQKKTKYYDMDKAISYLVQASNCDHVHSILSLKNT